MKSPLKFIEKRILLSSFLFFLVFNSITAQYTLTDDDVVVINGIIESCSYDFAVTDIIIPETLDGQNVVGIGVLEPYYSYGVFENKGITSLILPSTLTFIGVKAFYNNSISNLEISSCLTLEVIDTYAFSKNLISSINLSPCSLLELIGDFAFCQNLITEISLPKESFEIGNAAFNQNKIATINSAPSDGIIYAGNVDFTIIVSYAGDAKDLVIPSQVEKINSSAFKSTGLTSVNFSACDNLKVVDNMAFNGNDITTLDFSRNPNLIYIGSHAFYGNKIASINFSNCSSLTTINDEAFRKNTLTSIDLSACTKLIDIGRAAFYENSNLTSFILPNPDYPNFKGWWLDRINNKYTSGAEITNFYTFYHAVVPYTLTDDDVVVNDGVIDKCTYDFGFKSIIIPEILDGQTVTEIGDAVDKITDAVFYGKGVISVTFSPTIVSIGSFAFYNNKIVDVDFTGCVNLERIGLAAFEHNSLQTLSLVDCSSLKSIESTAFKSNGLTSIDLSGCEALNEMGIAAFNDNRINSVNGASSVGFIYARNEDGSINNEIIVSYGGASQDVIIPEQVKSISNSSFMSNWINSVDFSNCTQLRYIGNGAFRGNLLSEFQLPTPNIDYTIFNYWEDGTGKQYAGGVMVNDFNKSYTANLTGTLNATFSISDRLNPIANATIELEGYGSTTTNASGVATFEGILPAENISYKITSAGHDVSTGSITVVDDDITENIQLIITGFQDLTSSEVKIYPNPVSHYLIMVQPEGDLIKQIDVNNLQGQNLKVEILDVNQSMIKIDTKNLAKGIYFIRGNTRNNKVILKKFIKE